MQISDEISALAEDTIKGLSAKPKYLLPRYFYDDRGSRIFQDIMQMPEYYLTDCETEIFETHKQSLTAAFNKNTAAYDLVELGAGDGSKTKILLKQLMAEETRFNFLPVDISAAANEMLVAALKNEIPDVPVEALTGDYFDILQSHRDHIHRRKVILFLGSNIGNFSDDETAAFLSHIQDLTDPGDQVLIGFDLKKSPRTIMQAYDDPHGHTRRFNLNLLHRLNRELGADFETDLFEHHTTYDPLSGEVKSYLVSLQEQTVFVKALKQEFHFDCWEGIFMERSRKYDIKAIENLAKRYAFEVKQHFYDRRRYFADSLWIKK